MNAVPGAHLPAVLHWYRLGLWNIFTCLIYFTSPRPRKLCCLYTVQLEALVTSEQCAMGWGVLGAGLCDPYGSLPNRDLLWCMGINLVLMKSQPLFTWECSKWFLSQTVFLCLPASAALAAGWCLGVNEQLSDAILTWVVQTLVPPPCSPHYTRPAPPEPQQMIHFCVEAGWTTRAWQRNLSAHSSYIPRVNADSV